MNSSLYDSFLHSECSDQKVVTSLLDNRLVSGSQGIHGKNHTEVCKRVVTVYNLLVFTWRPVLPMPSIYRAWQLCFQNGRHLGSHKERRDWPQYCL